MAAAGALFAASYDDNSFQRKSRELSAMAERAYGEGDYDKAVEYAREAEENARLSEEYIRKMLLRADAETEMNRARTRMTWARGIKADVNFPDEYRTAAEHVDRGGRRFDEEDYEGAKRHAQLALEALSGVGEVKRVAAAEVAAAAAGESEAAAADVAAGESEARDADAAAGESEARDADVAAGESEARDAGAFPARYLVDEWTETGDCFWKIAENTAVYADPFLWTKLYEANKARLPIHDNPNLIMPGTIIEIPSLWGERREGLYDPAASYGDIREFRR